MKDSWVIKTPKVDGHSHFYDFYAALPGVGHDHHHEEGERPLTSHEKKMDVLRAELADFAENPQFYKKRTCYRDCLRNKTKDYISFCLQKQCDGATLQDAGKLLGLYKE